MMYEWMRRANGITGGSAYDKCTYDKNVTHWKVRLESNGVDYITILDGMDIPSEDKTAFYAYVMNGHSLEAIAEGLHRNGVRLKSTLKAIYEQLCGKMMGWQDVAVLSYSSHQFWFKP